MKVTTKGTYALRIMTEIAKANEQQFVNVSLLANKTKISEKYLEQIISKLLKANLLVSHRGTNGGYKLIKPAGEISIGEILRATEGNMKSVSCIDQGKECDMFQKCLSVNVWLGLDKVVNDYLNSVSLEDVISKNIKLKR